MTTTSTSHDAQRCRAREWRPPRVQIGPSKTLYSSNESLPWRREWPAACRRSMLLFSTKVLAVLCSPSASPEATRPSHRRGPLSGFVNSAGNRWPRTSDGGVLSRILVMPHAPVARCCPVHDVQVALTTNDVPASDASRSSRAPQRNAASATPTTSSESASSPSGRQSTAVYKTSAVQPEHQHGTAGCEHEHVHR